MVTIPCHSCVSCPCRAQIPSPTWLCGGGFTYALRKFGHLRGGTDAHAIHDMQVIGFGEAAPLAVVQHACPIVVVCGNGRTERDSDLLKAKLICKPF
jgi:hypothetical protein